MSENLKFPDRGDPLQRLVNDGIAYAKTLRGDGTPGPAREAELEERFTRLLALDAGWDSYGARRISAVAVQRAWDWWAGVIVVPCSDGGVQLEWHRDGVDVEIILREAGDAEVFSAYSRDSGGPREAAAPLLAELGRAGTEPIKRESYRCPRCGSREWRGDVCEGCAFDRARADAEPGQPPLQMGGQP